MKDVTPIYEEILQRLEKVIVMMESMHTPSLSFGTGVLMHTKEIHTVQAIGRHPRVNVTNLAEHAGVTKGAVSQTINKLVRKGLVQKTHPPGNDKEVVLELTELGQIGFQNHEKFHMDTLGIAHECYGDQLESKLNRINLAADDIHGTIKLENWSPGEASPSTTTLVMPTRCFKYGLITMTSITMTPETAQAILQFRGLELTQPSRYSLPWELIWELMLCSNALFNDLTLSLSKKRYN